MSAIGATPAVLAFSLARSRWRMYSGARPRKSRANTRTAQTMTALSMPTRGPGGDFNGTPSMDPNPSRPSVPRAYTRLGATNEPPAPTTESRSHHPGCAPAVEDARHDQPNDRPRHRKPKTKHVRGVERGSFLEEESDSKAGKKPHDHSHHAGGAGRLQEKTRDQADQAEQGRDQAEDPSPRRQWSDVIDDDQDGAVAAGTRARHGQNPRVVVVVRDPIRARAARRAVALTIQEWKAHAEDDHLELRGLLEAWRPGRAVDHVRVSHMPDGCGCQVDRSRPGRGGRGCAAAAHTRLSRHRRDQKADQHDQPREGRPYHHPPPIHLHFSITPRPVRGRDWSQSGYSSLRQARGSAGCAFGVRSSKKLW